jgi:hypothetical protein
VEFDLGSIAGCLNNTATLVLKENGIEQGKVIIRLQKKSQADELCSFRMKGQDLNFKLFCIEGQTNLSIQKQVIDFKSQENKKLNSSHNGAYSKVSDSPTQVSWITVYEISEHDIACNAANPTLVEATLSKLCSDDPRTPLKVSDFSYLVQTACFLALLWLHRAR